MPALLCFLLSTPFFTDRDFDGFESTSMAGVSRVVVSMVFNSSHPPKPTRDRGKSRSLRSVLRLTCVGTVLSVVDICGHVVQWINCHHDQHTIPNAIYLIPFPQTARDSSPSMFASEDSGFGCFASSSSFAESLSFRAASAGLKTLAYSRRLFAFLVLDLALLAIVNKLSACRRVSEW